MNLFFVGFVNEWRGGGMDEYWCKYDVYKCVEHNVCNGQIEKTQIWCLLTDDIWRKEEEKNAFTRNEQNGERKIKFKSKTSM